MKAILFGGSGMLGQGVLLELLARDEVTEVVSFGRSPLPQTHAKLRHVLREDLTDYADVSTELDNVDAVFFCLGVSSSGMTETDYARITHDIPLAAAKALHRRSPGLTFCFVSGAGTDASEQGRVMWARVKGRAENALQRVGFAGTYCFRPAYIQPMDGIESKTPAYRRLYRFTKPLYPLIKGLKKHVTSTRQIAFAMVEVAEHGCPKPVLESLDINSFER